MHQETIEDAEENTARNRHQNDEDDRQFRHIGLHQKRQRIDCRGSNCRKGNINATSGENDEDAKRKQAHHHTGTANIDQCRGLQECRVDDRDNRADCHEQKESDRFRAPANEVTQFEGVGGPQVILAHILLILRRTH